MEAESGLQKAVFYIKDSMNNLRYLFTELEWNESTHNGVSYRPIAPALDVRRRRR
jgi:hypothetical protein